MVMLKRNKRGCRGAQHGLNKKKELLLFCRISKGKIFEPDVTRGENRTKLHHSEILLDGFPTNGHTFVALSME